MATGHRIPTDLYNSAMSASNIINDPGGTNFFDTTGTIKVDISGGICKIDATVGNKRKLQSPTTVPEGVEITLLHASAAGTSLDVEYDGRVADANTTNIEMDNDSDWVRLVVLEVAGTKDWYTLASHGVAIS